MSVSGPASSHADSRGSVRAALGPASAHTRPSIIPARPTKMTDSITTSAIAIHSRSCCIAPLMIEYSLMKSPNGGVPDTANSPTTSSTAETGRRLSMPFISAATDVFAASTRLPTTRKSAPFSRPLLSTCSTAPYAPAPPIPRPSTSNPICSTLEYASSRLMSAWPSMNAVATAIDSSPNAISNGCTNGASPAASETCVNRASPRNAAPVAIRVGLPRMQRSQPHLGTEADEREGKGKAQPPMVQLCGVLEQVGKQQRAHAGSRRLRVGQQEHREQGKGDSDRRQHQVLVDRLERPSVAAMEHQRRHRERGRVHPHPQNGQVLGQAHPAHSGQKGQQATRERTAAARLLRAEESQCVGRDGREQHALEREHHQAERVCGEPPVEHRLFR